MKTSEDRALTPQQVCERTGFAIQTLANWRVLDKGPKWFRVGRSVRYWQSDVDDFMSSQAATTAA